MRCIGVGHEDRVQTEGHARLSRASQSRDEGGAWMAVQAERDSSCSIARRIHDDTDRSSAWAASRTRASMSSGRNSRGSLPQPLQWPGNPHHFRTLRESQSAPRVTWGRLDGVAVVISGERRAMGTQFGNAGYAVWSGTGVDTLRLLLRCDKGETIGCGRVQTLVGEATHHIGKERPGARDAGWCVRTLTRNPEFTKGPV